jgi:hypothetical protein
MSAKLWALLLTVAFAIACQKPGHETTDIPDTGLPSGNCFDNDGDGYPGTGDCSAVPPSELDCNDNDPSVHPGAVEVCNGKDDDCDGRVDNVRGTPNPLTLSCYGGPAATRGVGACKDGLQTCANTAWGACLGAVLPSPEVCNGVDDDCDGHVDNVLGTTTPLSQSCYGGPAGTAGVGVCTAGSQTCSTGAWGVCAGEVLPSAESCNGKDDDCDGRVDNVPGTNDPLTATCYGGAAGTEGVGPCRAGEATCTSGAWGSCAGQVLPVAESCNGVDDDCDGHIDNVPGTTNPLTQSCYDGPAGTAGVGVCKAGTQTCAAAVWGSCAGEVLPQPPACDGLDNNCNGIVDEPVLAATDNIDLSNQWLDVAFAPYYYSAASCAGGVNGTGTDVLAGGALVGTTASALFFQALDATGAPSGAPKQVEAHGYDVVAIAQAGDGFMLAGVWSGDHQSIDLAFVDATGNKRADVTPALYTGWLTAPDGNSLTNGLDSLRLERGNGKRVSLVWREVASGSDPDPSRQGVWLMSVEPMLGSSWSICDPGGANCPPAGTKYNAWTNTTVTAGIGADGNQQDWVASQTCVSASTLRHLAAAYLWKPSSAFAGCPANSSCVSYFDVMEDGTSAPACAGSGGNPCNPFPGTGVWGAPAPDTVTEPELVYYLPSSGVGAGVDQWLATWVTHYTSAPTSSDLEFWMTTDRNETSLYAADATDNGAASILHPRATATASQIWVTALRYVPDPSGFPRQMMSRWLDLYGSKLPPAANVELSALSGACGPAPCRPGNKAGLANWGLSQRIFYSASGGSPAGTFASSLTCD